MNKLRASYSVLSLWEKGLYDEAIQLYFKLYRPSSKALEEGKKLHEAWAEETERTKCLPEIFGGWKLPPYFYNNEKHVIQLEDWLELVGVPDLTTIEDGKIIIHEYKTGVTGSTTYANSNQIGIYALLVFHGSDTVITPITGILHHYNQHTGEIDTSYVIITEQTIREARDWVYSLASDMYHYFTENNLFERFGEQVTE